MNAIDRKVRRAGPQNLMLYLLIRKSNSGIFVTSLYMITYD